MAAGYLNPPKPDRQWTAQRRRSSPPPVLQRVERLVLEALKASRVLRASRVSKGRQARKERRVFEAYQALMAHRVLMARRVQQAPRENQAHEVLKVKPDPRGCKARLAPPARQGLKEIKARPVPQAVRVTS